MKPSLPSYVVRNWVLEAFGYAVFLHELSVLVLCRRPEETLRLAWPLASELARTFGFTFRGSAQ